MKVVWSMYGPLSVQAPVRSIVPAHSGATPVGVHTPPVHTSPVEQALPSSHGFVVLTCVHAPVSLHTSSVHAFPSSKHGWPAGTGDPAVQVPPAQTSPLVHGLKSSHAFVLGTCVH